MKKLLTLIALCLMVSPLSALAAFGQYRSVSIDHTKVPNTDQTDFPVLINGNYSYLATVANGGKVQNGEGFDIGFYTSNDCATGKLAWEVVNYNPTTGTVEFYVKNATLSHTTDTVFYMCYGDSSISTDQSATTTTWNANFKLVQHFGTGSAVNLGDSTSNANISTNTGSSATLGGRVGGGESFASGNSLAVASSTNFDSKTGSAALWFKNTQTTGNPHVLIDRHGRNGANSQFGFIVAINSSPYQITAQMWDQFNELSLTGTRTGLNDGNWHRMWFLFNNTSKATLYVDGTSEASGTPSSWSGFSFQPVKLATSPDTFWANFVGTQDEVLWTNNNPSVDWISTDYNNQSSTSTFYTIGAETPIGGNTVIPGPQLVLVQGRLVLLQGRLILGQ